jgi:hypothetical protein
LEIVQLALEVAQRTARGKRAVEELRVPLGGERGDGGPLRDPNRKGLPWDGPDQRAEQRDQARQVSRALHHDQAVGPVAGGGKREVERRPGDDFGDREAADHVVPDG